MTEFSCALCRDFHTGDQSTNEEGVKKGREYEASEDDASLTRCDVATLRRDELIYIILVVVESLAENYS
jgi:hypothetical protein